LGESPGNKPGVLVAYGYICLLVSMPHLLVAAVSQSPALPNSKPVTCAFAALDF